jgi:SAM-dependent methyltransferase
VEAGNRLIGRLGLTNLTLRQGDILELDPEAAETLGDFDYIIAHGVYSWVPPPVQTRLLWLGRRLLAPHGILYLSYNVLPGWRMRGTLRDILLDACRDSTEPQARLAAAEAAIDRLSAGIEALPGEAARYLREEIRRVRAAPRSYLYFEYLAEYNRPVLFRDLVRDCAAQGLRYLCDTELHTLFPASLGDPVERALADLEDGLDLEQWLDFISNRAFRQSLLIRDDWDGDEGISLERFASFSLCADLVPPDRPRLRDATAVTFRRPSGDPLEVSHPLTKAVLMELAAAYPDALPLNAVFPTARTQVLGAGGSASLDAIDGALAELFGLFARGAVQARLHPRRVPAGSPARPRAPALVRALVEAGRRQVPTRDHGNLDLDEVAARLIGYLDGSRDIADLRARLGADLAAGLVRRGPPGDDGASGRGSRSARPRSGDAADRLERVLRGLLAGFRRYGVIEDGAGG